MKTDKSLLATSAAFISLGFAGTAISQPVSAPIFSGAVQSIDVKQSIVVVAGKTVISTDASRVVYGQTVNVYGTYASDGRIVKASLESASTYVAAIAASSAGSVDSLRVSGTSVGGPEAQGISVGGAHAEGISVGGAHAEGISVGGAHAEGISVGGAHAEGISVGGESAN